MKVISAYHRSLFLGKITNTLTPTEQEELNELFATDEDAKTHFEELLTTLATDDVNESYAYLNTPGFWKDIPSKSEIKRWPLPTINIIKKISVAAVLAGLIAGGWFIWDNKTNNNEVPVLVKSKKSIELQLANGQSINLSEQKGDVTVGQVKLQNAGENLSYKATEASSGINTVLVPIGMDYRITLSDGSIIWMNSATRLDFPFNFIGDKREITIDGEAYLQITKNAQKPFVVHLPGSDVQVLGTEFNVNSYTKNVVSASLVQGGIIMSAKGKALTLTPGVEGIFSNDSLVLQTFQEKTTLGWRKGLYYFEEATLDDILPVLHRWFGLNSVIDRPELRKKQFAGILEKNKPVQVFLQNLKRISRIDTYFDAEGKLHFK